jgi:transcriptional regulator with XRE-family HTH domain
MGDVRKQSMGMTVRTVREAVGLTRKQLHLKSDGVSVEMIAKVEQGQKSPSPETLTRFAKAFGVKPEDLASWASNWEQGLSEGKSASELRAETLGSLLTRVRHPAGLWGPQSVGETASGGAPSLAPALPMVASLVAGPRYVASKRGVKKLAGRNALERAIRRRLDEALVHASDEELREVTAALDIDAADDERADDSRARTPE